MTTEKTKEDLYLTDADKWDSGKLGRDDEHTKLADKTHLYALEDSLGLQMISIRLQKDLINDLKFIGKANGVGYQPLIRDVLSRFVRGEVKQIMKDVIARKKLELKNADAVVKQRKVA